MKCILSWCHETADSELCDLHLSDWFYSNEGKRSNGAESPIRTVAFHDWIRRLEAERLNHGNGVANG